MHHQSLIIIDYLGFFFYPNIQRSSNSQHLPTIPTLATPVPLVPVMRPISACTVKRPASGAAAPGFAANPLAGFHATRCGGLEDWRIWWMGSCGITLCWDEKVSPTTWIWLIYVDMIINYILQYIINGKDALNLSMLLVAFRK